MEKFAEVPQFKVAGRVSGKLARKSLAGVPVTLGGKVLHEVPAKFRRECAAGREPPAGKKATC